MLLSLNPRDISYLSKKKKTCWLMQRLCIAFRRSMQLTLVVKAVLMPHHLIRLRILFLPLWHVHGDSIWFSAGSLFFFNLKQKNSRFFKKLGLISISNTPKSIWFSWPKKQKKKNNSKWPETKGRCKEYEPTQQKCEEWREWYSLKKISGIHCLNHGELSAM